MPHHSNSREAMKERGKSVETTHIPDYNYSCSSDLPCKKHPSSSSVGVCALCLKDRLIKLVCSDCGEQRLSSCSCSEPSNPNSCNLEIGSVGRVSFLIENEGQQQHTHSKPQIGERTEEGVMLKRSSSVCVDHVKRGGGFWKIGRLFRRKREKGFTCGGSSVGGCDEKSDLWVFDYMGVSRSRSLCSYRGGGFNDLDEGSDYNLSSAKISDVTGGMVFDSSRQSAFNEAESRKSGFRDGFDCENGSNVKGVKKGGHLTHLESDCGSNVANRSASVVKESDFNGMVLDSSRRQSGFNEAESRSGFNFKDVLESENGNNSKGVKKGGHSTHLESNWGSNVAHRSVCVIKESDFHGMDESAFIDLKLDLSSESRTEYPVPKQSEYGDIGGLRKGAFVGHSECGSSFGSALGDGFLKKGGSCRITVNDRGIRKGRNAQKVWKWIFRHHSGWRSATKKAENMS